MNPLNPLTFENEEDYRRKVAEVIKQQGWFAYSLMIGEEAPFRFSEDMVHRYGMALAAMCLAVLQDGEVKAVPGPAEADHDFQRFMVSMRYGMELFHAQGRVRRRQARRRGRG